MIILRYSSYGNDTIGEHLRVFAEAGSVWWGWWKKLHEPWPHIIEDAEFNDTFIVGLVNRGSGEFYEARCVEIAHDRGAPLPSPDEAKTPLYYGLEAHPLWFRFDQLLKVSREEWIQMFGDVPVGDDSLLTNRSDLAAARSEDSIALEVQTISVSAPEGRTGVLHISDLHFGSDHAYERVPPHLTRASLIDKLISDLPELPAAVVVSGDLTTQGQSDGLAKARYFLEELAEKLELDRGCVIVVPGNHDILVDDESAVRDMANEKPFRDFLNLYYGTKLDLERIHRVALSTGMELAFGTGNSSKYRANVVMDYGFVGWDRMKPVMEGLARVRDAGDSFTFYVLHHHLQTAAGYEEPSLTRPISVTLDAGDLVSLAARYRVGAVLHGHQHLPFVGTIGRVAEMNHEGPTDEPPLGRSVLTLGAGSLSVGPSRLGNEMRDNSFSFYDVEGDQVRVRVFKFNPSLNASKVWDFKLGIE